MKFSYNSYEKEFTRRTRELERAYKKGDTFKTICYLRYLSSFCYLINYKFTDDILEEITKGVSQKYLGDTIIKKGNKDRVVFYDNFGLKNRGIANIYVKALERLGYKITWILYEYAPEIKEIQELYEEKENITFFVIPKATILERMTILKNAIAEMAPKNLFIYTTPDDVAGIGVMSTIAGDITRYLIDLTDHAFWLGKCAIDFVIGFRNLGYNIAVQYRKISSDKVVVLPFYPDSRGEYPFEGLPFDTNRYEFVFSGGNPYKIEGDNTYKEIVQYILRNDKNMRFVYAGNGTNHILQELSEEFPNRFFKIAERKDLGAVLSRAKFYLSTYPIGGGLMTQYALQNQCIPISLSQEKDSITDPKTWMLAPEKASFVFYNKNDIFMEIDRIMCEPAYYLETKNNAISQVISEDEFIEQLKCLINGKKTVFPTIVQNIKIDKFLKIYKENASYEQYCKIIFNSKNKWVYKKHPFIIKKMQKEVKGP